MKKILFAVLAGLALVSCVKDETFPMASISGVKASDAIVGNDVTVTANVSALVDITAVNLLYSAGGAAEQTVKMSGSAGTYTGVIPSQADGTEVKYHVEATTSGGTTASAVSTITFSAAPPEPQTLFINEVDCGNKKFEIYNASEKAVDIAGYAFTKDDGDPWVVPAGKGNIPAKGFLVFTAKNPDINEGPSFGISGTKGFKLCMYKSDEVSDATLVDVIDNSATVEGFKTVADGWTLSRKTDGAAEWVLVEGGTIGYSNGAEPVDNGKIVINEVSCGNKQFEIYNGTNKAVDIAGYAFTKDDGDAWVVPEGKGNIPSKGFLVFTAKNPDITAGPSFGLSGTKGFKLCMYSSAEVSDATLVDMIDNSASVEGFKTVADTETLGRKTDGADEWILFSEGTIGTSNNTGTAK